MSDELLRRAGELCGRGLSVIPILERGKKPAIAWAEYQQRMPTMVELGDWFGNGRPFNIAIVTGAVSGVVAVDCDSPEAIAWADTHLPATEMRTRTGRGGEHRFFRHPGTPVRNKVTIQTDRDRLALDIRADGGYVIAPGSVHESGAVYERLGSWPAIEALPVFDPTWLEPEPTRPARPTPTRTPRADSHAHVLRRARKYLDATPPAIEGQGGDVHTYQVVCRVVRGFDLADADALDLLRDWNQRCAPPWTDAELIEKVESARTYGTEPLGGRIDDPRHVRMPQDARSRPGPDGGIPPVEPDNPAPAEPDVPLILDPGDPLPSARAFVTRSHLVDGVLALRHQAGVFYAHVPDVSAYVDHDEAAVRADLYGFLESAQRWSEPKGNHAPTLGPFKPTKAKIENVLDALRAVCNLPASCAAPCWLQDDPGLDPFDLLPCWNGLLHIPTRELLPVTPAFFTLNGLDFAYDSKAPEPAYWFRFLRELWPDDPESRDALQELIGYLLTPRTHFQKIGMLVGPKRSGKGTIGRVARRLLGDRNVCGPTLANMSEQFGLGILIGKSAAIIADARISGRADTAVITERLLSISGEDTLSIARKYLPDWNGKLSTRFLLLTNELPRIEDASGALASRFIVLMLHQSFYGREDHGLLDRFLPELPGILNWALEGYDRLYARGRFVQPQTSAALIQEFEDLGSPIGAFLRERCDVAKGYDVPKDRLFQAWKTWCAENGRERPGTVQTFGRNLRAATPWLGESQPRVLGARVRYYEGIRLRDGDE